MTDCPMPLDWHPAYADKTFLYDWLMEEGGRDYVEVAYVKEPLTASFLSEEPAPMSVSFGRHRLMKRECMGRAPYVGRPFHYRWRVGVDELGRAIAGDSVRWYDPSDAWRWPDPMTD